MGLKESATWDWDSSTWGGRGECIGTVLSVPRRSDSKLHSLQDNHPITKLLSTTNVEYKFGMEVPDAMINDAIKKKAGYTYYMDKNVENTASDATLYSSSLEKSENKTDDVDKSDMDLSNDNPDRDDDDARSDSNLHSLQDNHPITKLLSTTNVEYKFGMEVPDAMINDAIKKKAGYTYYMDKNVESKKAKIVDKPEEQHISLIRSGRGIYVLW
nr:hypothetical protein [Tanacetum cinerariifolium]